MLHALVHPADIQDRDGGVLVLKTLFGRYPFLKKLFADGGYQGPVFAKGQKKAMPGLATEIVKRSDTAKGFEVLPRRWVVVRCTMLPSLVSSGRCASSVHAAGDRLLRFAAVGMRVDLSRPNQNHMGI